MQARTLQKLRRICLALPEAVETETWGKPHFRVNDKIFCGCGEEDGRGSRQLFPVSQGTEEPPIPGMNKPGEDSGEYQGQRETLYHPEEQQGDADGQDQQK